MQNDVGLPMSEAKVAKRDAKLQSEGTSDAK